MPGVAWNAGMFAWQRGTIRAALEKYTPLPMLIDQAVGSELALANAYERITPISIDRAVMESAAADHHVVMGAMDVGWSDLGSWTRASRGDRRRPRRTVRPAVSSSPARRSTSDPTISSSDRPAGASSSRPDRPSPPARRGTIVADGVWAHLAGARHLISRGPRPARAGRP